MNHKFPQHASDRNKYAEVDSEKLSNTIQFRKIRMKKRREKNAQKVFEVIQVNKDPFYNPSYK